MKTVIRVFNMLRTSAEDVEAALKGCTTKPTVEVAGNIMFVTWQEPEDTEIMTNEAIRKWLTMADRYATTGTLETLANLTEGEVNDKMREWREANALLYELDTEDKAETIEGVVKGFPMTEGAREAVRERNSQITQHGFTVENDASYLKGELVSAAIAYIAAFNNPNYDVKDLASIHWPEGWNVKMFKPGSRQKNLAKAAALLMAALDREILHDGNLLSPSQYANATPPVPKHVKDCTCPVCEGRNL